MSDQNTARIIHYLRRVLDDCGLGGGRIATLYGSGYTFAGDVQPVYGGASPTAPASTDGQSTDTPILLDSKLARAREHHLEGLMEIRLRDPTRLPRAVLHLRSALALDPTTDRRIDLCWLLLRQVVWGQLTSAQAERQIQDLLGDLDFEPAPASVSGPIEIIRAEVLSLLGWRPDEAERLYAATIAKRLERSESLLSWGRHLLAAARPDEVILLLRHELDDQLPMGWALMALACFQYGRPRDALACLGTQLVMDPGFVSTHLLPALLHAFLGEREKAFSHLEEARASMGARNRCLDPNPTVAVLLACVGEERQAGTQLERALAQAEVPLPNLWALVALTLEKDSLATQSFERALGQRCYHAPLVLRSQFLRRHGDSPAVKSFRSAMTKAFPMPSAAAGKLPNVS